MRALLTFVSVFALGCAAGNDPGESGTEIGSGGTMGDETTGPTTADPSTTTTATTSPSTTTSTTTDDTTSSTTDAAESSSTGEGSSTTSADGSTGECVKSTEGCPCDPAADPECGDGLVCNADDICEVAVCDTKKDEPNDDPFDPFALTDLSDDDDPITVMSQLSGEGDVDWFQWTCDEPFFGLTTPDLDVTAPVDVRTCLFLDCPMGGNPLFECPDGTMAMNAPIDNLPGCCVVGNGSFTIDEPNCPDGSNDDVIANLRVDGGEEAVCADYSFTYGC